MEESIINNKFLGAVIFITLILFPFVLWYLPLLFKKFRKASILIHQSHNFLVSIIGAMFIPTVHGGNIIECLVFINFIGFGIGWSVLAIKRKEKKGLVFSILFLILFVILSNIVVCNNFILFKKMR